jgi:RNA polymerase sigma-70 factor, ECF subfamily
MEPQFDISTEEFERYRVKLRYKVWHHLGSFCADVEDIVQETLTRFLQASKEGKIRNPDKPGAFLSGVCNNVIAEYRRRIWRETPAEHSQDFLQEPELAPWRPHNPPELEAIEMREVIDACLAQLSSRDRELLQTFYLKDENKPEICQTLGWTDSQFRVALFRAKDRFRKVYGERMKQTVRPRHTRNRPRGDC